MIEIKKGTEPEKLKTLREKAEENHLNPKQAYELLNRKKTLKREVRESLIKEQGGLCAYCMCKIPREGLAIGIAPITIEHLVPRDPEDGKDIGQGLDYNNLLAVCEGNRGLKGTRTSSDLTCDAAKGNKEFRKINPCKPETLESITYTLDGKIDAEDEDVRYDLIEILNLNCPTSPLVDERKAVLDEIIDEISQMEFQEEDQINTYCEDRLQIFENEVEEKTPYVGIIIWYLKSLLQNNTAC